MTVVLGWRKKNQTSGENKNENDEKKSVLHKTYIDFVQNQFRLMEQEVMFKLCTQQHCLAFSILTCNRTA